jgi:ESS family glutamate:Na+ symporter
MTIVTSFSGLCLLLVLGKFARIKIKLLQRLYLPSSVIGGLLGLIIVQLAGDALPSMWTAGWLQLPGFLINIVFAALFLGVSIPPLSIIWRISGPQLAYGQIVAWGQYVIGLGLVLILLGPLFDVPDLFGVIIPIGFEGGHGTAAGLRETFLQLDWSAGSDFALASATVGIISAIITGITLINWAARKEYIAHIKRNKFVTAEEMAGLYPVDKRPIAGVQTTLADSIDSLAMHLAIIGIAILIGYGLKVSLMGIETLFSSLSDLGLFSGFPLFPLCMIGGLLVQLSLMHFVKTSPVDHSLMQRLAGTALDFLVVAAVSTIQLNVIARNLIPFIILCGMACQKSAAEFLVRTLHRRDGTIDGRHSHRFVAPARRRSGTKNRCVQCFRL